MSKIYVAEFPGLALTDQSDSVNILAVPPTVEYTVVVSAAVSGPAQPFQASTRFIEVSTDTTCSINIAPFASPAAALTNCRLSPGERVVRRVPNSPNYPTNRTGGVLTTAYGIFTTANA